MSSKIEEKIKNSNVLIYNDDVAVALKYESKVDSAPVLIYKSKHIKKVKETAENFYIPIYKSTIATNIANKVKINGNILSSMYLIVADIFALVINKQKMLSSKKLYAINFSKKTERMFLKGMNKKENICNLEPAEFREFYSKLDKKTNEIILEKKEPPVIVCSNEIHEVAIKIMLSLFSQKIHVFSYNEITPDSKIIDVGTI